MPSTPQDLEKRRRRSLGWVVFLSAAALVFDGYDLVVYGTVVPVLLADPDQLGASHPAQAGTLGSYALLGVLVGALAAGAVGDRIGRRKVMLVNLAWFSVGMAITATTQSVATFGLFRFFTGIGVGALVATVGALVAEFAPPGQRNRYNAIVYSGIPAGGVLAALTAICVRRQPRLARPVLGRCAADRGAPPAGDAVPARVAEVAGRPRPLRGAPRPPPSAPGSRVPAPETRSSRTRSASRPWPAAASPYPTALLGMMSFAGLLLTYGLNTWLPQIMGEQGYGKNYSLTFLLVLNLARSAAGWSRRTSQTGSAPSASSPRHSCSPRVAGTAAAVDAGRGALPGRRQWPASAPSAPRC